MHIRGRYTALMFWSSSAHVVGGGGGCLGWGRCDNGWRCLAFATK